MKSIGWIVIIFIVCFAKIFCDPYHQETRGFTFLEWLSREVDELLHGEKG